MEQKKSIKNIWKARDELSLRNFRAEILPLAMVLLLSVIIGDLRYLNQELSVSGIDSVNLFHVALGIGFLPIFFIKERRIGVMLRAAVLLQAVMLVLQLLMTPSELRIIVYLIFHFANGISISCGFYLFAFALNNVERLITMAAAQLYFATGYLMWQIEPEVGFFRGALSVIVVLALIAASFIIRQTPQPESIQSEPGGWESGINIIIIMIVLYHIISLMMHYIANNEGAVSPTLFGIGNIVSLVAIFTVMLIFNYSVLHLWGVCLVCLALGAGALYFSSVFAGAVLYGTGEGLGL